ncbi:MAG TPA: site-specific integrase [bacterium]|nr:site-specific integrase [bacterium]
MNKELAVLSHLFKKSIEWNLATANPVTGIERRPEPQGRTRWLTSEEESRLVGALPEKYRPVTRLAIHTGLRLGELRALSWRDVNLGLKPFLIVLRGKSQKTEDVPLNLEAVAILEALYQKSEHQDGNVFNLPSHFSEFFAGYAGDAGLHDVTFHTMRHTFCSRLVQAGVPIRVVQVLARHSRVEVTERYAHVGDTFAREAVGRLTERGAETRNTLEKVTQGVTENYQLPQIAGIACRNELAEARGSRTHPRGD